MKRPLAYITAAWGECEYENTENAAQYCRAVYDAGFNPICPILFMPLFLNNEIPAEHKNSIDMSRDLLKREFDEQKAFIELSINSHISTQKACENVLIT